MKLVDEGDLYDRLQRLLAVSTSVDIAMAWIRCGGPLNAILDFAKAHPGRLRVLCGVNGFLTQPKALSQLRETAQLKIAYGTSGKKLHSKMFLFHGPAATVVWVGSANLTESAFSVNRELVCEVQDDGSGGGIFDAYWNEFEAPDTDWLKKYAALCEQMPSPPPAVVPNLDAPRGRRAVSEDWIAFVAKLRSKSEQRLEWIAGQLPHVTHIGLSNWQQLSKPEAEKLLGIAKGYGGLGRLKGAGVVKNIFYEPSWKNLRTREAIETALTVIPLDPLAPAFEPMVKRAFDLVTSLDKVSVATVTRLLAIRHPDRFVSVNGASVAGLSQLSGIPQTDLHTSAGYVALIRWVMSQPWWATADPEDETSIYWRQRAALLDILVYAGDTTKGMEPEDDYLADEE
jgi:HKD family nuclease